MKTDVRGKGGRRGGRALALVLFAALGAWSTAAVAGPSLPAPSADGDVAALEARIETAAAPADLIVLAYRANPMIRAAAAEWKGVVEQYRVTTAWPDPEIMAEGMYEAQTLGETTKPMDWSVGLTQPIPLWGRQGSAGAVSGTEAKIARIKLDAAVRDVVLQVRQSAAELRYLEEAGKIARAQQELVAKLTAAGAAAFAGERASLYDVMKARAQAGQLDYDAQRIVEAARTERARLNALLDRPADAPVGAIAAEPARPLVYAIEEIDALAEANSEDLRAARAEVERAEAMAKLTRYETLPEFKLGVSYGSRDNVDQVGLQASLMLPLWGGKSAGRTGAAQSDVDRMRAMYRVRVTEVHTTIRDVAFRLRNAERLATLYRDDLVPQADRAVEASQANLSQGVGVLGDAAEAQSAGYSFRLALARAEADRSALLARLESIAGRTLTERGDGTAAVAEGAR